jgi:hypothetical protein
VDRVSLRLGAQHRVRLYVALALELEQLLHADDLGMSCTCGSYPRPDNAEKGFRS